MTTLLATRSGNYAAACSMDFSAPPIYYDTFALRDISGAKAITQTWPYFLSSTSRNALISNSPVPVKSCWNGITVFQADSFYKKVPLRFRGLSDSLAGHHLEASECCLIHADNELSALHGVWLNPNVRVSYNAEADAIVRQDNDIWPSRTERLKGLWKNRLSRITGFPRRLLEMSRISWRLRRWQGQPEVGDQDARAEIRGSYCMINEMQVLVHNGWAHV